MKLTKEQFKQWDSKAITLMGMSNVGKSYLSNVLPKTEWFHYSGDHSSDTRYLSETILDNIDTNTMGQPFLHNLLRSDSIYVDNKITVDNLASISSFIGRLGSPEYKELTLKEYKRRQRLHYQAEFTAMLDVPEFIGKAKSICGCKHFINDAGGSLCELNNEEELKRLDEQTLIIYVQTEDNYEKTLIKNALKSPKPLYHQISFLDEQLTRYLKLKKINYIAQIDPNDFVAWIFRKLFKSRIPRYEEIADKFGYTLTCNEVKGVQNEEDFLELIESKLE